MYKRQDLVRTGQFTVSECTLNISNHNNNYQRGGRFYNKVSGTYTAIVIVKAGYEKGTNLILRRVFSGVINTIKEVKDTQNVEIVCIDQSSILRDSTIKNFGVEKRNIILSDGEQGYQGTYDFPDGLVPTSNESLTGTSLGRDLQISIDRELALIGNLDPRNVKQTPTQLQSEGMLLENDPVVSFKSPYTYTTQQRFVEALLKHYGIDNVIVDETLLLSLIHI